MLYGGVNTENEVAVVTALQIMNALKEAGFEVVPGYVSKEGGWYLGDESFLEAKTYKSLVEVERKGRLFALTANRKMVWVGKSWAGVKDMVSDLGIEVVFPVFHGRNGEDGSIQGLIQLANLPMVGCDMIASAVGMDKFLAKQVAKGIGLNVMEDVLVTDDEWRDSRNAMIKQIKSLKLPVFVKPVGGGSSIGINKVTKWADLENAVDVGLFYDQRVLVEQGVEKPIEINISVMGNGPYRVSVTEQPMKQDEILSFEDKYSGGKKGMASAKRLIPANVSKRTIKEVEEATVSFFKAIGGRGISRVDFMMDKKGKLIFNEINTLPGSLAFYLWKDSGVKFADLVTRLVDLAVEDWQNRQKLVTVFESNILSNFGSGVKGKKG